MPDAAADARHPLLPQGAVDLTGAPEGFDALAVGDFTRLRGRLSVFVARDSGRAAAFRDALGFFAPDLRILELPGWDCLPYDRLGPSAGVSAQRMGCLAALASGIEGPCVLITQAPTVMQRLAPRSALAGAAFSARTGRDLDDAALERYFAVNGYQRASTVSERGEYAIRGGVIDAFPPGMAEPVRLDMFGTTLESIRSFDPVSQRSTRQLAAVAFAPVSEILLDADAIGRFRRGYVAAFGASLDDPLYQAVTEGARRAGLEHYLPLIYETLETVFDYLPGGSEIFLDHLALQARDERWALVEDAYRARVDAAGARAAYHPLAPERLYLDPAALDAALASWPVRRLSPFGGAGFGSGAAVDLGARPGRAFAAERAQDSVNLFGAVADHARRTAAAGKRVIFASWSEGSSERLGAMLGDHGLDGVSPVRDWPAAQAAGARAIVRAALPLETGFETSELAVISETDILGDRLARPKRRRRAQNFLAEASALAPGDLVVHIDHGIGRYDGLKTLDVQGAPHDCLELQYGGDAKLYLPVENIDLLTRYGSEAEGVQLDRLGGAAWQARKARAKERLREMAEGLIAIAAARQMNQTDEIDPPSGLFDEFCARFPYEETDDQLSSIGDVLADLASGHPMDRLICGDVGFGKTEVALRAAFVVAMSGRQVAIVCPTTLLARQHFRTFKERFQGWPVRIGRLSRLTPAREAQETRDALKAGEMEIVVGTHAVLYKQVGFRDLGLVIVDEEQHFGVKHKEALKALRAEVHVLTLSATPIPRTLQMSLAGIRDMSIIATPPVDRLAVRTYIAPNDPVMLREALLREKYRGGQAYVVAPRIRDLPDLERFLRAQVPEVRTVVGHGQMSPTQIEDVMGAFYDGRYDVLLSTTIVESGLDIPTANTLVVHRADMFGLAQLYQLRGRVGRSKARAYAYLMTPADKPLTPAAEKRLKVMQSLDSLGAGFQLASHDLDIRGGGNLLGEEQSGHIREVGVELYQQMLEDAVNEMRASGATQPDLQRGWSPQINTGAAVLLPESYIPDLNVRLALYRRLSEAERAEDREALAAELIDRFGPLPKEAGQLLKVVAIKGLCREANISKIDVGPKGAAVAFRNDTFANPQALVQAVQRRSGVWRIRPDNTLLVKGEWESADARLGAAERILGELAGFARA